MISERSIAFVCLLEGLYPDLQTTIPFSLTQSRPDPTRQAEWHAKMHHHISLQLLGRICVSIPNSGDESQVPRMKHPFAENKIGLPSGRRGDILESCLMLLGQFFPVGIILGYLGTSCTQQSSISSSVLCYSTRRSLQNLRTWLRSVEHLHRPTSPPEKLT